jgi:beta-lactamase class D
MYLNRLSTSFLLQFYLLGLFMAGCSVNKARQDDQLKTFFDQQQATGCFTMLDNATGEVTVYNLQADTTRYAPGSTLDILTALVGLETGAIPDENVAVPTADSTKKLSIRDAFVQSNQASFQWMAGQIGSDVLQAWIDSLGYGNKQLGSMTDRSWPNNAMRISPDEQLGLMKRLYFDQLPFRKSVQENTREWMKQEDNAAFRLYGRMAAIPGAKTSTGWYIGWIEENRHVYFFATLVNKNGFIDNMQSVAQQITRSVLQQYGFFQGKK